MTDRKEGLAAVATSAAEDVRAAQVKPQEGPAKQQAELETRRPAANSAATTGADRISAEDVRREERERLLGIDRITLPGCEDIARQAKEDGMELGAFAIVQSEHVKASGKLDAIGQMAAAAATVPPIAADSSDPVGADTQQRTADQGPEAKASAKWDKDAALRAEFGDDKDAYLAFDAAQSRGIVRTKIKEA